MIMNFKPAGVSSMLMLAVLLVFSHGASAADFEMGVFPDSISLCPCSAITPQNIEVSLRNLRATTDSYTFELNVPAGWKSQIQPDITLASGEEGTLDLFLINAGCSVQPGIYDASVRARSATTGYTVTQTMQIEVLLCMGGELSAADSTGESCAETPSPVTYGMTIKNLGKFRDTFRLSASAGWAGFSESEITLEQGESRQFSVALGTEGLPEGTHAVQVYARSADPQSPLYYTPLAATLELEVRDCYDFTADIQPPENTVCSGKSLEYSLIIENTGISDDTYSIFAPNWVSSAESQVSLGPGNKAYVSITATPDTTGSHVFGVTVTSAKVADFGKKAEATVNSAECRSVAVIVSPAEQTVCGGTGPVNFDVSVKNTGTVEATYQLSTSLGTMDRTEFDLTAGGTGTARLTVDTMGILGTVTAAVTASNGAVSDSSDIQLTVENCYSASLEISPESQSICPYDSVMYTVTLRNTGELPDTYTLRYGNETEILELGKGESESFELTFLVPFEESGIYVVSSTAESEHVSVAGTAALSVMEMDACFSAEVKMDDMKVIKPCTVEECETIAFPVEIKNTGQKPATYDLMLEGPEWVYMEPTEFDLEPGDTGKAYFYLSPGFSVGEDAYGVDLKLTSQHLEVYRHMDVIVSEDAGAVSEPGDVKLNVSKGNITGAVIGGERPLWKTVAVAVIALVIVIILALRFILLVKK
jgi:uncharacterized membrane protein